jgi:lactate permease
MWQQVYDPFGNSVLSTIAAAIPVITLLVLIATGSVKTHLAALIALLVAILIAVLLFTMPAALAIRASILGAVIGFFPIGWIVLNVIFMYRLTVETGAFATLQQAIGGVTRDRRLQLLLIAFSFGAFFEGASGFGTPVAVTAAILIGLGFSPLAASGLSLIANTAPVAYGALGTPIVGLASVTGLDPYLLGAMVGRQLPFFSLIVPAWADLRLCRLARNGRDLAGNPRLRGILCDPPIPDLEFYQPLDCRYRRFADLDGVPDLVS